jgi:hypothetical protein
MQFVLRLPVLFIILNCFSFTQIDSDTLLLQSLNCATADFQTAFSGDLHPFDSRDFGGLPTAYQQLCYAHSQIIAFQNSSLKKLLEYVPDLLIVEHRFSEFLPEMSLANISVWSYLAHSFSNSTAGWNIDSDLVTQLGLAEFPLVRLINARFDYPGRPEIKGEEMVDFFGLCESDWRYGFARIVPKPTDGRSIITSMDSEMGRRYGFFVSMMVIYDPECNNTRVEQYATNQKNTLVNLFYELRSSLFLVLTTNEINLILIRVLPSEIRKLIPAINRPS